MYTHTRTRTRTQTDRRTRGVRDRSWVLVLSSPPPPTYIHGLSSLSLFKVRIPFGPRCCPPRPPLSRGTHSLSLSTVYLLSLVVLHRAVPGNYAKGGVEREKKNVSVCIADFLALSSLP